MSFGLYDEPDHPPMDDGDEIEVMTSVGVKI